MSIGCDGAGFYTGNPHRFAWQVPFNEAGTYPNAFHVSDGFLTDTRTVTLVVRGVATVPAVYHVALTGDDTTPGTAALPFRTLAKGTSVLKPGDTLLLGPGTYDECLTWTGDTTIRASDNVIRNSRIHDNMVGIGLYMGDNNLVCNNVIWHCPGDDIVMAYGSTTSRILSMMTPSRSAMTLALSEASKTKSNHAPGSTNRSYRASAYGSKTPCFNPLATKPHPPPPQP